MMTITLPSEIEARLKGEANRRGVPPEEYATRLIAEHLPSASGDQTLRRLFAQWEVEDQTTDAEELARRNRDALELKEAMNLNRTEAEGPNTRKPFP